MIQAEQQDGGSVNGYHHVAAAAAAAAAAAMIVAVVAAMKFNNLTDLVKMMTPPPLFLAGACVFRVCHWEDSHQSPLSLRLPAFLLRFRSKTTAALRHSVFQKYL
jgi:hypothetical protein